LMQMREKLLEQSMELRNSSISTSNVSHYPDECSTGRKLPSSMTASSISQSRFATSSGSQTKISSTDDHMTTLNPTRKPLLMSGSISLMGSTSNSFPWFPRSTSPLHFGSSVTESTQLDIPVDSTSEKQVMEKAASFHTSGSPALPACSFSMACFALPQTLHMSEVDPLSSEGLAEPDPQSVISSDTERPVETCVMPSTHSDCPLTSILKIVISASSFCTARVLSDDDDYTTDDDDDVWQVYDESDDDTDDDIGNDDGEEEEQEEEDIADDDGIIFTDGAEEQETSKPRERKVRFAEEPSIIPILNEDLWCEDYAKARIGTYRCDAARFRDRINSVGEEISWILSSLHRDRVYGQRFTNF